ncbi:hypothetical protein ElyMa_001004000 [Elysia marginata]|uniref:Uncharacterized protein n=1 Tax=Elysia marginata TaxID=1093978 RepID=A0AAV4HKD4_9GAST|nr:hypothetical protein ElyMa_001004000 [Elysia marginata]
MAASDHQVLALCDEVWKWRLKESPELSTFCGFYLNEDSWDDISSDAYTRREKCVRKFLEQALALNVSACSPDKALSHRLLVDDMKLYLQGCAFQCHLMPINYLEGAHVDCCRTLAFMKYDTEVDFTKYIQRLKALPSKPFRKDYPDIPTDKMNEFQQDAKDAILSGIFPALANLKDFIQQEYIKAVRPQESICCLKNGQAWYLQCLDYHLNCKMTPQQIHDIGVAEVARIQDKIFHLSGIEGLGQTSPEILNSLKRRQRGFFKSKEEVLTYVKDLCYNKIRPKLARLFKALPDVSLKIEEVPAEMKDSPAGYYFNGTADGSRQGCFYVNSHNFEERLPYSFTALCLHEGEPGHHLQASLDTCLIMLPMCSV